jgi:integrase
MTETIMLKKKKKGERKKKIKNFKNNFVILRYIQHVLSKKKKGNDNMSEIQIKQKKNKKGIVYQYCFEIAPVDGKRQWATKSGFKTEYEAMAAGVKAKEDYENIGLLTKSYELSFADLLDEYIEKGAASTCKQSTIDGYKKKARLYIKPYLGKYRVKSIVKQNVKDFLVDMYDKGFSFNTISVCKGIVTACFDYAVDNHYINASPAYRIKMPSKGGRPPKEETRLAPHIYVKKEQMEQIFERFPEGSPNYLALMLGYHCGLRLGETFGLTWNDIDFENKTIEINRQVQWRPDKTRTRRNKMKSNGSNEAGNGYWYFSEPKYGSYRIIDIDDEIIELLKKEKAKQEKAEAYYEDLYQRYYVDIAMKQGGVKPLTMQLEAQISNDGEFEVKFINRRENGSYITPRTLQHTSSVIHHKIGIKDWDYHSLRHTHSTMLSENGAPLVYIQKRLGHKNIDVTTQVYTNHLTDKLKEQGNDVMKNLFVEKEEEKKEEE